MEDYPSNSNKKKTVGATEPAKKKIAPVIKSEVITRKKPLSRKFSDTFFSGANAQDVISYVVLQVMLPAAKDMFFDAGSEAMRKVLFGDSSRPGYGRGVNRYAETSAYGTVNYNSPYSSKPAVQQRPEISQQARARHNFDEIIIKTRPEAEFVLENLYNVIAQYEIATVSDLYDLVNMKSDFTDNKYGWTDLSGSNIQRVAGGYLINLPKPRVID